MSSPESASTATETIHLEVVAPEAPTRTVTHEPYMDWLGAVIRTSYMSGSTLVVSSRGATELSNLWRQIDAEEHRGLDSPVEPPIFAADPAAGIGLAAALAAQGLRVTFLGDKAAGDVDACEIPGGVPFVLLLRDDIGIWQLEGAHFELVARGPREAVDFLVIAQSLVERTLCPGVVRLNQPRGTLAFERVDLPDVNQLHRLLGNASDEIDTPTEDQHVKFGARRRRVPVDISDNVDPQQLLDAVRELSEDVFERFAAATGRAYARSQAGGAASGPYHVRPRDEHSEGPDEPEAARGASEPPSGEFAAPRPVRVTVHSSEAFLLTRRLAAGAMDAGVQSATVKTAPGVKGVTLEIGSGGNRQTEPGDDAATVLIAAGTKRRLAAAVEDLASGGILVVDGNDQDPEQIWRSLPESVRKQVIDKNLRVLAFVSVEGSEDPDRQESFEAALVRMISGVHLGRQDTHVDDTPAPGAIEHITSNGTAESWTTAESVRNLLVELSEKDYQLSVDFYDDARHLRQAAPPPDAEISDDVLRELLAFHHTGRNVGRRLHDSGLVPASLYEYLNAAVVRGPYPVCLVTGGDAVAVSLTAIIDDLISRQKDSDDDDRLMRLLLKMDAAIRRADADQPGRLLSELWDRAAAKLAGSRESSEGNEDARRSLAAARRLLEVDGPLLGFSPETHVRLIAETHTREWRGRFAAVRTDAESLAIYVDDFLRADFGESAEAQTPDHLEASVGKAFADELDFYVLSGLMQDAGHGQPMPETRRRRLESVVRDLRRLPKVLAGTRSEAVLKGPEGLSKAVARVCRDRRDLAALVRAVRIALLEISGKYREDLHDPVFARFGVQHLTDDERALCPPYLVDVGVAASLSGSFRAQLMDVLASDMPITAILSVDDVVSGIRDRAEDDPPAAGEQTAMLAVGLGTAYVFQSPGSEVSVIAEAAQAGARFKGPALYSIYVGARTAVDELDPYLASAIALESRAFPAIEFNPSGRDWADRFAIGCNPDVELNWGQDEVEVSRDGEAANMTTPFTFADFLTCDTRYLDYFRDVPREMWHPAMIPINEFLLLDEAEAAGRVPYLWMADEEGDLHRVAAAYPVADAMRRVLTRWKTLQELGGVASSHAERLVEEAAARADREKREAIEEVRHEYESELERATGEVAREIVSNIAAGLLGLQQAAVPPSRVLPSTPSSPVPTSGSSAPSEAGESDVAEAGEQKAVAPAEEEEDEIIALDDPYVETARCTTCNECTNINSRLFAYNENQQAYIKDASAGTYRELVLAAEKCPVRIIHPGKPLNPDEAGLDELIERAKPYM